MTCDERRVVAFLNGQLSVAEEQAFDQHLLACEACWRAVQEDRLGRQALDQLRMAAPPGLADRVTAAVSLANQPQDRGATTDLHSRHPRQNRARALVRRPRTLLAGAALLLAALGGALGWALHGQPAGDPPQIAKVAAMLSPNVATSPGLRAGERFDFGGQPLTVRSYRVEGVITLVATSARPFPLPVRSHVLTPSSPATWMASRGTVGMYGVNRPAGQGRRSILLVAAMPVSELPQVAARLHLT